MSAHGWIALTAGAVLTLAVWAVLMALFIYSSRRGYDDPPTFVGPEDHDDAPK